MRKISSIILISIFILTISCGRHVEQPAPPSPNDVSLQELKDKILPWAWKSPSGIASKGGDDGGDSLLWEGLLCLSGEMDQCNVVPKNMSEDGRLWRSPELKNNDDENSFSRDMLLGFLSYLVRTKDTVMAEKYLNYVTNNGYKLCPDATDIRCTPVPSTWGIMRIVWNHIGLDPSVLMYFGNVFDETSQMISAKTCDGYECHLVAVTALITKKCDKETTKTQAAINTLIKRYPENPFFVYLSNDFEKAEELVKKYVPKTKPTYLAQWSIERNWDTYNPDTSMIWEWIFLINLLQNK